MMWCWKCVHRKIHYFHDDGSPVRGELQAQPDCDQCHLGVEHAVHDHKAFNTNQAYEGG